MRRKRAKKTIKKPRVKRTRNAETWTEAMYWQRVRRALRDVFRYWKPMMLALKAASRPYRGKNKLQKVEYQCAECKNWFRRDQVQIDHKIPCGSLNSEADLVLFLSNLTPESPDAFQVLCKKDHKKKTLDEKKKRKQSISNI